MDSLEVTGKTVEEAIRNAEKEFGLPREQLNITILREARSGILGLGGGDAKILAERFDPESEVNMPGNQAPPEATGIARTAQDMLEELLEKMGIEATVNQMASEPNKEGQPAIVFDITGDDVGILIGRHGQTISSLQFMLRVMIAQQTQQWFPIVLDVDGYKERRYEALRETALRLAEQVKSRRMPFTLEPMPANERRIIHMALADNPGVTTESSGEGDNRKVTILPKNQKRS